MMEKIWGLIGIHYQLQNNGVALLRHLSDGHAFLDPDLDKISNLINLSHSYIEKFFCPDQIHRFYRSHVP